MSSATKTLKLLEFFSPGRPTIGLSQFCKLAKRDKATTYRHLQALEEAGFVEQNETTKQYRLGPALLQLAHMRELTVPRKVSSQAALSSLSNVTGETAHVTVLSGNKVYPLLDCESPKHSTRAIIDLSLFPLHATASGLCALAFGPENLMDFAVDRMEAFTPTTVVSIDDLRRSVAKVRETGFANSNRGYEHDIQGVSCPIFDSTAKYAGAVSVACVASRFTPELEHLVKQQLIIASREITHNWGGLMPADIEKLWTKSMSQPPVLEAAK